MVRILSDDDVQILSFINGYKTLLISRLQNVIT